MLKSLGASIFVGIMGAMVWYNINNGLKIYPASESDYEYEYEITYPKMQFTLVELEGTEIPAFNTIDLTNLPATPNEIEKLIQKAIEYIAVPDSGTIIDYPSSTIIFSGSRQNRSEQYSVDLQLIDTLLKSPERNNVISFTTLKKLASNRSVPETVEETIRGLEKRYAGNLDTLFIVPQAICTSWLSGKIPLLNEMFALPTYQSICAINSTDTIATLKLKRLKNSRTIERPSAERSLIKPILVGILSAMMAFSLIMTWNSFRRFQAKSAPPN